MKKIIVLIFIAFSSIALFSQEWIELNKKSDAELAKKNYPEALKFAHTGLSEVGRIYSDTSKQFANQLGQVAKVYYTQGELDSAIKYYKWQIRLILDQRGTDNPIYARAINNLSVVFQKMGKLNEIEPLLLESIKIKREVLGAKDSSYAKTLNNLAQYYQTVGRYPESEKLFLEALEIKKKELGTNSESYGISLLNMGMLYRAIGNNDKAKINLELAAETLEKIKGIKDANTSSAYFQYALCLKELGDVEQAEKIMNRVGSYDPNEPFNIVTANTSYNLAQVNITFKKYKEAKVILERIAPLIKKNLSNTHPLYSKAIKALGIVYWIEGDLPNAYKLITETVAITKHLYDETNINYASAIHNLAGLAREMGEIDEAEAYYKEAFDIYRLQIQKYFPYYSESEKSKFYSLLKERFEMYNCFILTRYKENPLVLGNMYDYHLSTKGLMLDYATNLKKNILGSGDTNFVNKYYKWIEEKEYLSKLLNMSKTELKQSGVKVEDVETRINNLEKELSLKSSEFNKDSKFVHWKDIQSKLKPDEAAIEIVRFKYFNKVCRDSTFYLSLIITKETTTYPMPVVFFNGLNMDGFHLKNYKKLIKNKFPDKKSFEVYWADIEKEIPDKKKIYLSADGVFNLLNINSLRRNDGTYPIDDKEIILLNSTADLISAPSGNINTSKEAILIGNPLYKFDKEDDNSKIKNFSNKDELALDTNYQEIKISPLPGTQVEINNITEMLTKSGWNCSIKLDKEANETNVKQIKSPALLHIATHGYFLSNLEDAQNGRVFGVDVDKAVQNPLLRSGLLFAGATNFLNFDFTSQADDQNGILTSYEALNLNLDNTELVVLSACETGVGEVMNGEGVYGLQRAFKVAGAKSMIMSLWTVNDQTTQELMTEFYTNWLSGLSLKDAFTKAQKTLKSRYPDPYYWAAFVLISDVNKL